MGKLSLYLPQNFDKKFVPVAASRARDWWEDNNKTANHAKHCLPLSMANSLGYYILSPATFMVRWNGDVHSPAEITVIERCSHGVVDNHAAFGSFTVQAGFVPVTEREGDFLFVKGIPNERGLPYSCMEAVIEAWWSVGDFGLVYLLNQPGEFMIRIGQPIAQMFTLRGCCAEAEVEDGRPPGYEEWRARRHRPDYRKDLDYMRGVRPNGDKVEGHVTNWKSCNERS